MPVLETIGTFAIAILLGGMVFFPTIVAPTVFKSLDQDSAGKFLRRLFPGYYAFMIVTSLSSAVFLFTKLDAAAILIVVAISTLIVRQALVPKINAWRDRDLAGDTAATKLFNVGHRVSVIVNLMQLAAVAWIFWRLLAGAGNGS